MLGPLAPRDVRLLHGQEFGRGCEDGLPTKPERRALLNGGGRCKNLPPFFCALPGKWTAQPNIPEHAPGPRVAQGKSRQHNICANDCGIATTAAQITLLRPLNVP